MSEVVLGLARTGKGSRIAIDGQELDNVASVDVRAAVGMITTVTVEYHCFDVTVFGDDVEVIHVCPFAEEDA